MTDAEHALRDAARISRRRCANDWIPPTKLSDEDRKTIVEIACKSLARFQPKPEPDPQRTSKPDQPGHARKSHERHHGESAPKDHQCWDLQSVVRTMKAVAASSIGQYEPSVRALADYYRDGGTGLGRMLSGKRGQRPWWQNGKDKPLPGAIGAVVFGSDQGLVGQFNDVVADYAIKTLAALPANPEVWAVGERVHARLADAGAAADRRLRRAELRQGHHPACRADSHGERDAPPPR